MSALSRAAAALRGTGTDSANIMLQGAQFKQEKQKQMMDMLSQAQQQAISVADDFVTNYTPDLSREQDYKALTSIANQINEVEKRMVSLGMPVKPGMTADAFIRKAKTKSDLIRKLSDLMMTGADPSEIASTLSRVDPLKAIEYQKEAQSRAELAKGLSAFGLPETLASNPKIAEAAIKEAVKGHPIERLLVSAGIDPNSPEGKQLIRNYVVKPTSSTSTTVNMGSLSKDTRLTPEGRSETIPGSPREKEELEKVATAKSSLIAYKEKTRNVVNQVQQAIDMVGGLSTGLPGQLTENVGGTPAARLSSILDTIGGNIAFSELQAMRQASPTGGALGQVSNIEIELLKNSISSLNLKQGAEQLKKSLAGIKKHLEESVDRLQNAYESSFGSFESRQDKEGWGIEAWQ